MGLSELTPARVIIVPSLSEIIVLPPDPVVGTLLMPKPIRPSVSVDLKPLIETLADREEKLRLPEMAASIPVAELYDGLDFDADVEPGDPSVQ